MTKKLREGQSPCPCFLLFPCSSPKLKLRSAATIEAPLGVDVPCPQPPPATSMMGNGQTAPHALATAGSAPPELQKAKLPSPASSGYVSSPLRSLLVTTNRKKFSSHPRTDSSSPSREFLVLETAPESHGLPLNPLKTSMGTASRFPHACSFCRVSTQVNGPMKKNDSRGLDMPWP